MRRYPAGEGKIINVNYLGSLAQRKMHFASSVEVVTTVTNELFNAISLYVPMSQAAANIAGFDPDMVSPDKPAVFTCVLENYKKIMKGRLLDQYMNVYRQDTNASVIVYLIVVADDVSTTGMWEITPASITFAPLSKAFEALYFISYIKMLFDETMDGAPVQLPSYPGTPAAAQITLSNSDTSNAVTVAAGTYTFNDGVKDWIIPVLADITIPASGSHPPMEVFASTPGSDAALSAGTIPYTDISPAVSAELVITVDSVIQGTDPDSNPGTVASRYFDLSLALAYLCKLNIGLSCFFSQVKLDLPVGAPDTNVCWIRSKTSAEEKEAMTSLITGDRSKYYWGALYLMECLNTMVAVHSEPVNILAEALAEWFRQRNESGQFVANKLSLIRLSGTRIKPFGYPSWLNSEVNVNDDAGFDILDAKHVGYLQTISDNSVQDCSLSRAHGVTGFPVSALMISKFVDYNCAMACANMITDKGTLTDPVLTDEEAYAKIQSIVEGNLAAFVPTRRLNAVRLTFPDFTAAKKGLTALEAATAWSAMYTDDLDEVAVYGGITAA
jgi:hypothetical protein